MCMLITLLCKYNDSKAWIGTRIAAGDSPNSWKRSLLLFCLYPSLTLGHAFDNLCFRFSRTIETWGNHSPGILVLWCSNVPVRFGLRSQKCISKEFYKVWNILKNTAMQSWDYYPVTISRQPTLYFRSYTTHLEHREFQGWFIIIIIIVIIIPLFLFVLYYK